MQTLALYAVAWFLAGYAVTWLVNAWFRSPVEAYQGGLMGLIVGLIILMPAIRTERGRRLFYEGPAEGEEGDPVIGCLFLLPILILIVTIIAWLVEQVWPIN